MLKRQKGWANALHHAVLAAKGKPFQWGIFDCAMGAGDLIQTMTGVDPGAADRGQYRTEAEALARMGGNLGAYAAKIAATFGMKEVPRRQARRGDLVMIKNSAASTALGVVDHSGRYALCAASSGYRRVRMHRWQRAWRVG